MEWKQIIEYGKAKLKSKLVLLQEKHIRNIETMLEKSAANYESLRHRIEAVELDTLQSKEQDLDAQLGEEVSPSRNPVRNKIRIIRTIRASPKYSFPFSHTMRLCRKGTLCEFQPFATLATQQHIYMPLGIDSVESKSSWKGLKKEGREFIKELDEIEHEGLPISYEVKR